MAGNGYSPVTQRHPSSQFLRDVGDMYKGIIDAPIESQSFEGYVPTTQVGAPGGSPGLLKKSMEEFDMAAITSAIIAGGSIFGSWMGQRQASKVQEDANRRAEATLAEAEDFNRKREHQTFQRQRGRLMGSDETYRNTMAQLGIPGLPDVNIPQTDPSAFTPPPAGYFPEQYAGAGGGYASARDLQARGPAQQRPGINASTGYIEDLRSPPPRPPRGRMSDLYT